MSKSVSVGRFLAASAVAFFSIGIGVREASAAVAVTSANSAEAQMTKNGTQTLTGVTVSGTNTLLVVGISMDNTNNTAATTLAVSGVTYGGTNLTQIAGATGTDTAGGEGHRVEMWYWVGPPAGSASVVVKMANYAGSATDVGVTVGAITFSGVNQTTPIRTGSPTVNLTGGTNNATTITIPSATNDLVLDTVSVRSGRTLTKGGGAGQTQEWNILGAAGTSGTDALGGGSVENGAATNIMTWTFDGGAHNWAAAGISIEPATLPTISMSITKTGPAGPVTVGANITYTLTGKNNDTTNSATNVVIADTLPPELTWVSSTPSLVTGTCTPGSPVSCTFPTVLHGATPTVTVVATVTSLGTGSTSNQASISADNPGSSNTSSTVVTTLQGLDVQITKTCPVGPISVSPVTIDGTASTQATPTTNANNVITYSHTVTATSGTYLIVGVSLNINNLAATVGTVTYNAVGLTQLGTATLTNSRMYMYGLVAPASGTHNIVVTLAGFTVTAHAVGTVVGSVSFANVNQTTPIGTFVSATGTSTAPTVTAASNPGALVIDTLAALGNVTVSAFGAGQTSRWNLNTAGVTTTQDAHGAGSTEAGATSVTMSETLSASSTWAIGAVGINPASNITYTLTAKNNDASVSATNVTVSDTLPLNLTWVSSTPSAGTCNAARDVTCNLGTLAPGASATVTVTADVASYGVGSMTNTAVVVADQDDSNLTNNSSSCRTTLAGAAGTSELTITKTASPNPVTQGGNVTFTLTVQNNGPASSTTTVVTDTLPAGLTWVSSTPSQGPACTGSGSVNCALGTIANGGTATVTIVATATTAGAKSNTGAVTSATVDPNATDSSTITLDVLPTAGVSCATPGKDGTPATLSGIVNTYFPGTVNATAVSTSLTLGAHRTGDANVAIAVGDLLLVIQMQDASINSTNSSAYGDGTGTGSGATSLNSAGRYEYVVATSALATTGGAVNFTGTGGGGHLNFTYTNADATTTQGERRFQVIRVPQYVNATVSGVVAPAWSTLTGATNQYGTGGVVAIDVAGTLTVTDPLGANAIDASGLGFRGGGGRQLGGGAGANTDYRTLSTVNDNGSKAEGIAGTPEWVAGGPGNVAVTTNQPNDGYPNGSYARGAPGNAGGGSTDDHPSANDDNSGGGGGGNGGAGGTGGNSWNTNNPVGGIGSAVLPPPSLTQVVMGGGGGAGTQNNSGGINDAASGASGGGIVILRAMTFAGAGTIESDGADAPNDTSNDGGGGGGAGGSIIVLATSTNGLGGITLNANGGRGGDTWDTSPGGDLGTGGGNNRHGPGGGGGGGAVLYQTTASAPTTNVLGGDSGTSTMAQDPFNAKPGFPGTVSTVDYLTVVGVPSGAECVPDPALTMSNNGSGADCASMNTGCTFAIPPTGSGTGIFTLTVPNVATHAGTTGTVVVTDTLPSTSGGAEVTLTPTSASGTGWTCTITGQVVSCSRTTSDSIAAGASYPPISIDFSIVPFAQHVTLSDTNSGTVSVTGSATGDLNTSNDTAANTIYIEGVTEARLLSFDAERMAGGIDLKWRTGFEVENLGFYVYRERNGVRTKVAPSIIAGSALLVGEHMPLQSGFSYEWFDDDPAAATGAVSYWLEDIDLHGNRTMNGPFEPKEDEDGMFSKSSGEVGQRSALLQEVGRARQFSQLPPQPGIGAEARETRVKEPKNVITLGPLYGLPAAKIEIDQEGWYRVTRAQMAAAGYDPGPNTTLFHLYAEGQDHAFKVHQANPGNFGPNDSIEFYGTGLNTFETGTRVYWLAPGTSPGLRVAAANNGSQGLNPPPSFPFSVLDAPRTVYFASLLNDGTSSNFFGPEIGPDPDVENLTLSNLDTSSSANDTLEVGLQGVTTGVNHLVQVMVNGHDLGTLNFADQENHTEQFSVPNSWLIDGTNGVTLNALGGDSDQTVLDHVRLTYPHLYRADSDLIEFTVPGSVKLSVGGFSVNGIRMLDITNPNQPQELPVTSQSDGMGGYFGTSVMGSGASRTVLAFTDDRVQGAAGILANKASNLSGAQNQADLVIIAHPSLISAVAPLATLRQSQGLKVATVDVTDIYDEFNFGEQSSQSIRDFLALTNKTWKVHPKYVLLVGDGTVDPRNYVGLGTYNLVPIRLIPATLLMAASDDWFVDFNNDGIPEMAMGRLPVKTLTDATTVIGKITGYDTAGPTPAWRKRSLLVADQNDEFNFENATSALMPYLTGASQVQSEIKVGQVGPSTAHDQIVAAFNAGQQVINFTGHGSVSVWATTNVGGDFFDTSDADALTNGAALPVVVTMNCLNGFFQDVLPESLAEAFLENPNGGAVAVWASSALTEPTPQSQMNQTLFQKLFSSWPSPMLGVATNAAKGSVTDPDVRRTWILFGDPTMKLHP